MPRNYPPAPDYSSPGSAAERRVWQALQALPDAAAVFAQVRVLDRRVTREADFVVAWPGVGLAVLEVKGGGVWTAGGEWFSTDRNGEDHPIKDPIDQAARAGYALRDFVVSQGGTWPASWATMAVLPDTPLPKWFGTADAPPERWVDSSQLAELTARIEASTYDDWASAAWGLAEVEMLVNVLEHRLPRPRERDAAAQSQARADLITRDQYAILRALRANNRITVNGGPGTGKTWLAMEHARTETAHGARVAVLCYNRALALSLQRVAEQWDAAERPAVIATLHGLALDRIGEPVPDPAPDGYWDALPHRLASTMADLPSEHRFDIVIVDEAQDFDAAWWPAVHGLLADPDDGQLVVFRDDEQSLYDRGGGPDPAAVSVELRENVRNTRQIADLLAAIPGSEQDTCRGLDGPAVAFVETAEDDVADRAAAVADGLIAGGQWQGGDIALLTTWRRHPRQAALIDRLGPDAYSALLAEGSELAVSTVQSFKGLERPVIVLAVNGFYRTDGADDLLRVGASRATHRLIVVGDRATLRDAVGDHVLAALGEPVDPR
jgi:hypothetical protein